MKGNAERIFIDISSVKGKKYGPSVQSKRHWSIMVDEQNNLKFTKLFSTNNGMTKPTLGKIDYWEEQWIGCQTYLVIKRWQKRKIQEREERKDWKMNIDFKYTAQDTP